MTSERDSLSRALKQYVSETYKDLKTIQRFIRSSDQWIQDRQNELNELEETGDSDEKLGVVLKKTLCGLDNMKPFLDAMERLAVTSDPLSQALLAGADQQTVCLLLYTAQILSPLLLLFKLDNQTFFRPNMLNKDVSQIQLQHYITAVRNMCDEWKRSPLINARLNQPEVSLKDLSEEDIANKLSMIRQLDTLRKDQNFRMVDLFGDRSQSFRKTFSEVKPQVLELMKELEGCAQQLDRMNQGARISGTVSSSMGIVGGVLSIVGLIGVPFTGGLSLGLTAAGTGLGVTSGVQGIVTSTTELGVNNAQTNKAEQAFDKCVQLMNELQDFLNDVIEQHFTSLQNNFVWDVVETTYGGAVFADGLTGLCGIIYKRLARGVAADAAHDLSVGAAAVGRAGTKGVARVAKYIKIGTGVMNGVFAGVDGYFLYRDIKSLVGGTETEMSKWIRARAALWSSEIESWQKVHDSLDKGEKVYEEYKSLLKKQFLPLN